MAWLKGFYESYNNEEVNGFNSTMAWLKAPAGIVADLNALTFQFHNGLIKGYELIECFFVPNEFQFHNGLIKGFLIASINVVLFAVSIPQWLD